VLSSCIARDLFFVTFLFRFKLSQVNNRYVVVELLVEEHIRCMPTKDSDKVFEAFAAFAASRDGFLLSYNRTVPSSLEDLGKVASRIRSACGWEELQHTILVSTNMKRGSGIRCVELRVDVIVSISLAQ
jgi:hypothetical protein